MTESATAERGGMAFSRQEMTELPAGGTHPRGLQLGPRLWACGAVCGLVLLVVSCRTIGPGGPQRVLHPESAPAVRLLLRQSSRPVLIVFTSASCVTCRTIGPTLESLAADYAGRLLVVEADLEFTGGLIQDYNLTKVPTAIVIRNGRELARRHGVLPPVFMRPFIDGALRQKSQ